MRRNKNKTIPFLHINQLISYSVQQQIRLSGKWCHCNEGSPYNGNIFGNKSCRCNEGSLYNGSIFGNKCCRCNECSLYNGNVFGNKCCRCNEGSLYNGNIFGNKYCRCNECSLYNGNILGNKCCRCNEGSLYELSRHDGMSRYLRKRTSSHMRPTKTQISRRNFVVHLTKKHSWLSKMTLVKSLIRLRESISWYEPLLGAHVRRYVFWNCGAYFLLEHNLYWSPIAFMLHNLNNGCVQKTLPWTRYSNPGQNVHYHYALLNAAMFNYTYV